MTPQEGQKLTFPEHDLRDSDQIKLGAWRDLEFAPLPERAIVGIECYTAAISFAQAQFDRVCNGNVESRDCRPTREEFELLLWLTGHGAGRARRSSRGRTAGSSEGSDDAVHRVTPSRHTGTARGQLFRTQDRRGTVPLTPRRSPTR